MITLDTACYGLAAATFLALTILLSTSWRGHRQGAYLILACMATAGWALFLALAGPEHRIGLFSYIAEILRGAAWLFVLTKVARLVAPRLLRIAAHVCWGALLLYGIAISTVGTAPSTAELELLFSRGGLLIALVALLLLEQIFRNSNPTARRSLRYFVLGVGLIFAFDLFLYAQAELLRQISPDVWAARGLVNALAVPFLAVAVRRNPDWSLDIFVSRQVVFYSATFMTVGVYLLLMAGGGLYVREIGGAWGVFMQVIFLVGALFALLALVSSATFSRRVRVFISKHFYRNKYDYRIEWLRFSKTLGSATEEDVRRTSIEAVAQIFASSGGLLFTAVDDGRRFSPVAAWPIQRDALVGIADVPATAELVQFLEGKQWVIDLAEYRRDPQRYQNLQMPEWLAANPVLRIVSPVLELKRLVGFFVLYEPPAPFELTYEDRDLLNTAGRQVATHIAQHDTNRKLAESRQFEAYNRLTAFLMHDLKNSVAQLQLLVTNASRHKRNPEFVDDAIETIANTVERMTRLIEQLRGSAPNSRLQSIALHELVATAVARCEGRVPVPKVATDERSVTVRADPERLTAVLEHVIRNAQEATPEDGSVIVSWRHEPHEITISITDSGCGMPAEFVRERLFQPFDSTKGAKGMGIGAYQAREYVQMLGGHVVVESNPGRGTVFSIILPLTPKTSTPPSSLTSDSVDVGRSTT